MAYEPFPMPATGPGWKLRSCIGFLATAFVTRHLAPMPLQPIPAADGGELMTVTAAGISEYGRRFHEAQLCVANVVASANARGWPVSQGMDALLFWSDRPVDETAAVLRSIGVADIDLNVILTEPQCESLLAVQQAVWPAAPQPAGDRRDWRLADAAPSVN